MVLFVATKQLKDNARHTGLNRSGQDRSTRLYLVHHGFVVCSIINFDYDDDDDIDTFPTHTQTSRIHHTVYIDGVF